MAFRDVSYWKEVISDQIDLIISNKTWELVDFALWFNSWITLSLPVTNHTLVCS